MLRVSMLPATCAAAGAAGCSRRFASSALVLLATCVAAGAQSFRHDVMPVFSKSGCNAGACHGSASGKGNFKLSLRGENPEADFATLTQDRHSKRLNTDDPAASFVLKKPAKLVDHEGGQRFKEDSAEYRILRDWIAAGAPNDPADAPVLTKLAVTPTEQILEAPRMTAPLTVTATFSNGSSRDVTRWAVYEPANLLVEVSREGVVQAKQHGESTVIVRFEHLHAPARTAFLPHRPDFQWSAPPEHNFIDTHVFGKLRTMRTNPSALCDDVEFLRRAYFDITGRPPARDEAAGFLNDPSPDKRVRLVDALLERPEFAAWWAQKWADLFRVEERVLDRTGTVVFFDWLRNGLAADKPLDQFAREIVAAAGSTYQNPPANYYRALREPVLRSETTAQVFLGTRLACAKCHNHPFERWTQDDYYRFAAVFDGLDYAVLRNDRRDENDKLEFVGEQVVRAAGKLSLKDPRTKSEPAPAFLGAAGDVSRELEPRMAQFAQWLTAKENPLFAKVMANRAWAHLLGKGLVDPVDDFRLTNPPSIPALLDALAEQLVRDGFRLKPLLRAICASRTYQLASEPNDTNRSDTVNFSRALVRRHPAEPLLDAIHAALGVPFTFRHFSEVQRAVDIPGARFITKVRGEPTAAEVFLKEFGKPPRATACECERVADSSLGQVLTLVSGPGIATLLRAEENRLGKLLAANHSPAEMLTDLYWNFLSRPPSDVESTEIVPMIESAPDKRAALEDIAWSLLNSKEFLLRR